MVKPTIILTGSKSLNRKLANLKSADAKRAIRTAARAAMRPVQAASQAEAPVKSGRLRKAIKIRALKRSRSRIGISVSLNKKGSMFGGKTFYGAFQEFGWRSGKKSKHDIANLTDSRKQNEAKHFMQKAAKRSKRQALNIYVRQLRDMVFKLTWG